MSIKSAIAHLHSIFTTLEHPGSIPEDIKEYALKGIKSELQKLIDRVDLSLGTVQNTLEADGAAPPETVSAPPGLTTGTYAGTGLGTSAVDTAQVKQDASLMPDYLPQSPDNPDRGPSIDLAAISNDLDIHAST